MALVRIVANTANIPKRIFLYFCLGAAIFFRHLMSNFSHLPLQQFLLFWSLNGGYGLVIAYAKQ